MGSAFFTGHRERAASRRAGAVLVPMVLLGGCRAFLYQPTHLSDGERAALATKEGWQSAQIDGGRRDRLVGLVRPPAAADSPWVLYFGGNAMGLGASQRVLDTAIPAGEWGTAVFAYRGYDGSTGAPKQKHLCADAVRIAAWLRTERGVTPDRLVLMGQSLGTGVAADLAATLIRRGASPRALVLISPFTSMDDVVKEHAPWAPRWLVADKYRTRERVSDLTLPVLIVHGTRDEVVDVRLGRALADRLGERCSFEELPGLRHNDLWGDPRAAAAVQAFLRR